MLRGDFTAIIAINIGYLRFSVLIISDAVVICVIILRELLHKQHTTSALAVGYACQIISGGLNVPDPPFPVRLIVDCISLVTPHPVSMLCVRLTSLESAYMVGVCAISECAGCCQCAVPIDLRD